MTPVRTPPTVGDLLMRRAVEHPEKTVYTHLTFDGSDPRQITYGDLFLRACAIAGMLERLGLRNHPVLLVYPAGPEFAPAFFGALLAHVIAVPVPVPQFEAQYQRLDRIAADCNPGAVLSTGSVATRLKSRLSAASPLRTCPLLSTDGDGEPAYFEPEPADPCEIALLQYTSGSTAEPRGVAVSHGNLAHNIEMIEREFQAPPGTRTVSWLPHFHDMGLISGIVEPIRLGGDAILMAPLAFLQRPLRWLEAISQYRGQAAGAPNFAYDLCVKWANRGELPPLDLSSWQIAFVGAEPVRFSTLERFAARFRANSFRASALLPCYGMAEATLLVSCKRAQTMPASYSLSRASLDIGHALPSAEASAITLTGCGYPVAGTDVRIVDPRRRVPLPDRRVGEVWVRGPQVAHRYWNRSGDDPFNATLADSGHGPFLRTGDLGFVTEEGELVFVDRLRDLIVINGQNYICHDLELTAGSSHELLSADSCVAVSIESHDKPYLVVLAEFPAVALEFADKAAEAIRSDVFTTHGLPVQTIAFVPPRKLSRTTSGKLQRRLNARRLVDGSLRVLIRYGDPLPASPALALSHNTK